MRRAAICFASSLLVMVLLTPGVSPAGELPSGASTPSIQWSRDFGSALWDAAAGTAITPVYGNVFSLWRTDVTGSEFEGVRYPFGGVLTKLSPAGVHLWSRPLGLANGMVETQPRAVAADRWGSAFVVGSVRGASPFGSVGSDVSALFIVKYRWDGELLWSRFVPGQVPGNAVGEWTDAATDEAGNLYVSGDIQAFSGAGTTPALAFNGQPFVTQGLETKAVVAKVSPDGELLWVRDFPALATGPVSSPFSSAAHLAVTPSGNAVVDFRFQGWLPLDDHELVTETPRWALATLTSSGAIGWAATMPDTLSISNLDVSADGVAVVGAFSGAASFAGTALSSKGQLDGVLLRYGPQGEELWSRVLSGASDEYFTGVAVTEEGDVYVYGTSQTTQSALDDAPPQTRTALVAGFSAPGVVQWVVDLTDRTLEPTGDLHLGSRGELHVSRDLMPSFCSPRGCETYPRPNVTKLSR